MTARPARLIEVALPLPLFRTFTYRLTGETPNDASVGSRVVVPFRDRRVVGICLGDVPGPAVRAVKDVVDVPDADAAVSAHLLAVCQWISAYYVVPVGLVLRGALPTLLTGAAEPRPAQKTQRIVVLRQHLPTLLERDRVFARAPRQREVYELLESLGGRAGAQQLQEMLRFTASVLTALVTRGLVSIEDAVVSRDPFASRDTGRSPLHPPTPPQRAAIAAMTAGAPGDVYLLHGITGSGKTLVYIELLRELVERRGKTAIVLVPEIALTPQTVDRFRSVFGDRIAVLHSALSDGERYDAWLALERGEKRIAVGARSAIFAPLCDLGAIIVDEEHEASYKQGETPRYHAREVAIMRAQLEGAMVVLGSATPSLESWSNAAAGKYRLLELRERVGGGRLPSVEVVDLRQIAAPAPNASPATVAMHAVVSPVLELALADRLDRGEQSILLLNRRGYASFVQCGECGEVVTCQNCSISLTYHRTPERLVCHYCQHGEPPSSRCRRCNGMTLRQRGLGTQQVERLLSERFPSARIARMDVDTTGAKWAHAAILDRVESGDVDVLLGTQMIAKGLDFANVTLVGVIDADVGINLPDFRASERCYQLMAQVAGRAGRGPKGGRVLIQTRSPSHHAVRCAVDHDYERFVREELAGRAEPPYPPTIRLANIVFSGTDEDATMRLAERGAAWLRRLLSARRTTVSLIGPAPCAVERIKNRWRWHLFLKADRQGDLTRIGSYFLRRFDIPHTADLRVTFDRDPMSLM